MAGALLPIWRLRAANAFTTKRVLQFLGVFLLFAALLSLRQESTHLPISTAGPQKAEQQANTAPKQRPKADAFVEPTVNIQRGSKGIVLCLYNRAVPLGASLITELRCLGNDEPIEIYHCSELSKANMDLLRAIDSNLKIIDVCADLIQRGVITEQLAGTFRGYWIKPLALHYTTLEQVILIDSDAMMLRNPADLRDIPGYKEKGTVFFYDRVIVASDFFNRQYQPDLNSSTKVRYLPWWIENFDYARFGLPGPRPSAQLKASWGYRGDTCHEMDSSLVLIDKRRAGKAMSILWFLTTEHRFDVEFSLGDKEVFWLAYEFAQVPYFFSPWGASVLASQPNRDVERYAATLCGCLCHYMPTNDPTPELLYVNGRNVLDFVPFNVDNLKELRKCLLFNMNPSHMTPRHTRARGKSKHGESYDMECNVGLGKTPTPPVLRNHLWRRRLHFLAISMNMLDAVRSCDMGGQPTFFE